MADKQYVYAVARIRSKELSLLSGAFLEQLTAAKDYDECIQLLMEKGWGEDGITNAGDILAIEKRKTWELINELVKDMSVFDVFLYANDYHNLKAAIKEVRMGDEYPGIFMEQGADGNQEAFQNAKEFRSRDSQLGNVPFDFPSKKSL